MKELIGGLWFGAMLAGALLGLPAGIILFVLGAIIGAGKLAHDYKDETSWRKQYPSYKY